MFKIGDFSKLTFVSIRMLRYYDEINLFKPVYIDDFTNYRYYSAKQIPELNKIIGLKNLGFKAEEIRSILNSGDTTKQVELLRKRKMDIEHQIQLDEDRLVKLDKFIKDYNKEESNLKFEAVLKQIPVYNVVYMKAVIAQYNEEGELWGRFMGAIHKNNLMSNLVMGGMCYARFFEDEHKEGAIHIEIGNEARSMKENVDGLEYQELEGIDEALCVLVSGPYEPNIQEGFNFVAKWLEENEYEFCAPPRTIYIKGPGEEENPENFLTEIQVPIKKK